MGIGAIEDYFKGVLVFGIGFVFCFLVVELARASQFTFIIFKACAGSLNGLIFWIEVYVLV